MLVPATVTLLSLYSLILGHARPLEPITDSSIACNSSSHSSSGAILAPSFNPIQQNAIFWTAIAVAVFVSVVQGAITTLTQICEAEGLWTVRFRLGVYEHFWWTGIAAALIASMVAMIVSFLAGNTGESLGILVLSTASSLAVFRYAWPAWRNRHYCYNRWMAWTGPSRTGIDSILVPYIGGPEQWKILDSAIQIIKMHPVEKRPKWLLRRTMGLIRADPTDLLKRAHALNRPHVSPLPSQAAHNTPVSSSLDRSKPFPVSSVLNEKSAQKPPRGTAENAPVYHPTPSSATIASSVPVVTDSATHTDSSPVPTGLYAPVIPGKSVSLLWGRHLGFEPRVSRGILSMPQRLLTSTPRTEADHDGQAMCLAHGILARNKGLAPWSFILSLDVRKFEEKSVQWPHPAKVLRSYYEKEMTSMYGGLGDAFVKTATELALLLADSPDHLITDWLEAQLEQQDLALSHRLHELGASPEDLQLMYQLSYAAMLVSLGSHVQGHRLRPEMSLFVKYMAHVGRSLPAWTTSVEIQARLAAEKEGLTTDLVVFIEAVLPPPAK